MKIGILTFHSQLNYGGVLQTYAMQQVYEALGHDVIVLDRWLDPTNRHLLGVCGERSIKRWIRNAISCFYGIGYFGCFARHLKSIRFVRGKLHLTPYHFFEWKDAPKCLGVDLISVGSDQVWNANLFPPGPYLLEGAPRDVPAIAYAASLGMREIPQPLVDEYRIGFGRFKSISCREESACRMVRELGVDACRVVDPTLLCDKTIWLDFVRGVKVRKRRMLVYVLAEDVMTVLSELERQATTSDVEIIMLIEGYKVPFAFRPSGFLHFVRQKTRMLSSPVKILFGTGPIDFVREIYSSEWIVANSFHALMFAAIFDKNVRIIVPSDPARVLMHDRMKEFASDCIEGKVMCETLEAAIASCLCGETVRYKVNRIAAMRAESVKWLENAIISA